MDAFKVVVIVTLVVAVAAVGFIAAVTYDVIDGAKIPSQEYGTVVSKAAVTNQKAADYAVTLVDGRVFYIQTQDNSTLYGSLKENVSYVFNCRIDYTNQMTLILSATQQNRTAT
ncbi:MAG: hypothetical protein NWE93_04790 [Candidatus Bathyarchaeota archaeon]|nr:hypothetical protein [Candidatus Bathyarchaeota archaeon]